MKMLTKRILPVLGCRVVCIIVCLALSGKSICQQIKSWQISTHAGISTISGDVLSQAGVGGGISVQKKLSPGFGVRADYTGSINTGLDVKPRSGNQINDNSPFDPWQFYYSGINKPFVPNYKAALHQFSLNGVIDFIKWKIPGTTNQLSAYGSLGYSLMIADVDIDNVNTSLQTYDFLSASINYSAGKKEVRKQLKQLLDGKYENNAYYANRNSAATKNFQYFQGANVGVGAHFSITDKYGIGAEYTFTPAFTDLLDGIKTAGGNDVISYISIRATFGFGNLVKKTSKRMNADGSKSIYTSTEIISTVSGFANPSVQGEVFIKGSDTSYFLNFTFIPSVPSNITSSQMVLLKLSDNRVIMLPYAGEPEPLKINVPFTFRTKLQRDQIAELQNSKTTNIKIETSSLPFEDKIKEGNQTTIADICRQMLRN